MPAGGRLMIRTEPHGEPACGSRSRDTGAGMPADVMAHALRPVLHHQAEGEGTGLGLSVVYGIVERAAGRIEIDSSPGAGTRFTIELPVAQGHVPDEPAPAGEAGSLRGVTVLVVDDQASVRTLASKILESREAHVIASPDARSALAAMAEHEDAIDVVLIDIVMPGCPGSSSRAACARTGPPCHSSTSRGKAATSNDRMTDR